MIFSVPPSLSTSLTRATAGLRNPVTTSFHTFESTDRDISGLLSTSRCSGGCDCEQAINIKKPITQPGKCDRNRYFFMIYFLMDFYLCSIRFLLTGVSNYLSPGKGLNPDSLRDLVLREHGYPSKNFSHFPGHFELHMTWNAVHDLRCEEIR